MTWDKLEELACGEIGLAIDYFYKLSQRQFYNIVNGYRKKEDFLSRERWLIARKMMYAAMVPYLTKGEKETDIIKFSWEEGLVDKLTEEEQEELLQKQEDSKAFWAKWDERKKNKA